MSAVGLQKGTFHQIITVFPFDCPQNPILPYIIKANGWLWHVNSFLIHVWVTDKNFEQSELKT